MHSYPLTEQENGIPYTETIKSMRVRDGTLIEAKWIQPKDDMYKRQIPLVMISGFACTKEDWFGLDTLLASYRPVLVYDHRGIGNSDVPKYPYTIEMLTQDLLDVLDHLFFHTLHPLPYVDLFGISMGGVIAQNAALISPHKIRKMILGCTTHGGPSTKLGKGMRAIAKLVQRQPKRPILTEPWKGWKTEKPLNESTWKDSNVIHLNIREELVPDNRMEDLKDPKTELLMQLVLNCIPESFDEDPIFDSFYQQFVSHRRTLIGIKNQFHSIMRFNFEKRVGTINQETLILHGDKDELVPLSSGELINQKIRASKLHVINEAGHFFWVTHLIETYDKIESFLSIKSKL